LRMPRLRRRDLPKGALEVDRLRRGPLNRSLGATDHALDRAQETGLKACGLEQRVN